jgi:hypothetical protein
MKKTVAVIASVSLLLFGLGAAAPSFAADEWETWPPTKSAPTAEEEAAAKAGEEAGKKTTGGISKGTLGWGAAIVGGAVLIGVAAFSGSSTSNH